MNNNEQSETIIHIGGERLTFCPALTADQYAIVEEYLRQKWASGSNTMPSFNPSDVSNLTVWGVAEERDGRIALVDPRTGSVVWPIHMGDGRK